MSGMSVDELCAYLENHDVENVQKAGALSSFLQKLKGRPSLEDFNKLKNAIHKGVFVTYAHDPMIQLLNSYDPYEGKRKEMTHVLGLENNPDSGFVHEGWSTDEAVQSIINRYKALSLDDEPIPIERTDIYELKLPAFLARVSQARSGDYIALASQWALNNISRDKIKELEELKTHTVSIHVIQDRDLMHFIYVNRGDRHLSPSEDLNRTVIVYSCDLSQRTAFATSLYRVFSTESKEAISVFLESPKAKAYYNPTLSHAFNKTTQAVGNCTIANTNISWHFHLATQLMKRSSEMTLSEAYQATKREYKKLRLADRVEAFIFLLKSESAYKNQAAFYRDLLNVMIKFRQKMGRHHMEATVERLSKDSPELLSKFFEIITSEAFNVSEDDVKVIKDWTDFVAEKLGVEAPIKKQKHSSESGGGDAMTFSPLMSLMSSSHTADLFKGISPALFAEFLKASSKKEGPAGGSDLDGPK